MTKDRKLLFLGIALLVSIVIVRLIEEFILPGSFQLITGVVKALLLVAGICLIVIRKDTDMHKKHNQLLAGGIAAVVVSLVIGSIPMSEINASGIILLVIMLALLIAGIVMIVKGARAKKKSKTDTQEAA